MSGTVYTKNILEDLALLSNHEMQKAIWFAEFSSDDTREKYGQFQTSYAETVEMLFGDSTLSELYSRGEIVFGKEVDGILKELDGLTDLSAFEPLNAAMLEAPQMKVIRQKATQALELISVYDGNESTVEFLEPGQSSSIN